MRLFLQISTQESDMSYKYVGTQHQDDSYAQPNYDTSRYDTS